MTTCALSINYTADETSASSPSFSIAPEASGSQRVRFSARNLRSVDRLDVCWSNAFAMKKNDKRNPAAVALGRLGRAANTPAQQDAARANGRKGGRPTGKKDVKPRKRRAT